MRHLAAGIRGARDPVLVARGKAQPQTGHRVPIEHRRQTIRKDIRLELGRRDEIDLRLLDIGHGVRPLAVLPS